jgi:lysophospholipase L1-like esterase
LLALCIASAAARAADLPPEMRGVHHICTMGASITQYAARPGGYVWLMQRYLNLLYPDQKIWVEDVGVAGNTSMDMVNRFRRDVIAHKPDLVTIKAGFNDMTRRFNGHKNGDGPDGADPKEYGQNVETMVKMAKAAGIRVLIMTPTIYEDSPDSIRNQKLAEYSRAVRGVAAQNEVLLADQNKALLQAWDVQRQSAQPQPLTTDHVHLTDRGDAVVARTTLLALGIPAADLDAATAKLPMGDL